MANFSKLVITDVGKQLLNLKLNSQQELLFTEMVMSESKYDMAALEGLTDLDGIRQRVGIRKMSRTGNVIQIDSVFLNSDLEEGYFANTLGIYARLGEDPLVLFAVAVEQTRAAYMPQRSQTLSGMEIKLKITLENADNITIQMDQSTMATVGDVLELESSMEQYVNDLDNPHQVTKYQVGLGETDNTPDLKKPVSEAQQEAIDGAYQQATGYTDQQIAKLINGADSSLDTLGEIAQAMKDNEDVVQALDQAIGTKANQAEVDGHTGNTTIHITASERQAWNDKQTKTGDTKDNIVTFESGDAIEPTGWANVALVITKEKVSSLMRKFSLTVKNMRYLFKLIGNNQLSVGDGTITGAINALNTGLNNICVDLLHEGPIISGGIIPAMPALNYHFLAFRNNFGGNAMVKVVYGTTQAALIYHANNAIYIDTFVLGINNQAITIDDKCRAVIGYDDTQFVDNSAEAITYIYGVKLS